MNAVLTIDYETNQIQIPFNLRDVWASGFYVRLGEIKGPNQDVTSRLCGIVEGNNFFDAAFDLEMFFAEHPEIDAYAFMYNVTDDEDTTIFGKDGDRTYVSEY
jgi:hypothetical protein